MGCILCKWLGRCFGRGGGKEEPSGPESSVSEPLLLPDQAKTSSSATDHHLTTEFPFVGITPKREGLNRNNTLGSIPELERELKSSKNKPQLHSFIKQYLTISDNTKTFFTFINQCLWKADSSASFLFKAVNHFHSSNRSTSSVIEILEKFKLNDDTFPSIVQEFRSSCDEHVSRVEMLSELDKNLDENIDKVESWKSVGSIVCCVTIFGLSIGSMVLSFMGSPQVAEGVLHQGSNAIERLEGEINKLFFNKRKIALVGEKGNVGALLQQAIKELNNIKALQQQTLRAIELLDIIKKRIHMQVEACMKLVEEEIGVGMNEWNDEETNEKMAPVMHEIKTEAVCLDTCVNDLMAEVCRCRTDLNTALDVMAKVMHNCSSN